MSEENQGTPTAFYLGVEGEQSGPFSQEDLVDKIRLGLIAPESLVWWEGQRDWTPISRCALFSGLFQNQTPEKKLSTHNPKLSVALSAPGSAPQTGWSATYLSKGAPLEPVYNSDQSTFETPSLLNKKVFYSGIGLLSVIFLIWGYLEFSGRPKGSSPKKGPAKISQKEIRRRKLSEATSSLLLKPEQSISSLQEIVEQNVTDAEGQEAAEVLLNYFRQNKLVEPAADLLLKLDRPDEAAKLLLAEPQWAPKAEKALFQAFKKNSGKISADYLIDDINLILKNLNDPELAKERILLFEKTFPGLNHPFSYYLQNQDQKIKSLFTRISFRLVDSLKAHLSEEFPQLTLAARPVVEIKRTSSGALRVVGRYSGDLILKTDKLRGIYFLYWLVDGQWLLVDTNLTLDRQNFAQATRRKYENSVLAPSQMLSFLENEFKKTYPNQSLHETPSKK